VKKSKLLEEEFYDGQIERMSSLEKFPHVPAAKQEVRRTLRRISESDPDFIRHLISYVVDTARVFPTPADLLRMAGEKRQRVQTSIGKPDCKRCGGSGFVTTVRKVSPSGIAPYEAEFAAVCTCRGGR
jgi:hypothetical protein